MSLRSRTCLFGSLSDVMSIGVWMGIRWGSKIVLAWECCRTSLSWDTIGNVTVFLPETNSESPSSRLQHHFFGTASHLQQAFAIYKAAGVFPSRKCDVKHNTYLMGTTLDPHRLENCGVLQFLQCFVFFPSYEIILDLANDVFK